MSVCIFKWTSCFNVIIHKKLSGLLERHLISEILVFPSTQIRSSTIYQSWSHCAQCYARRIYVPFILSYSVINRQGHCIRYTIHMDHFTLNCMVHVDWSDPEGTGALWGDSTTAQCTPWLQSRPEVKMASLPDLSNVVDREEKSSTIYFDCLQILWAFYLWGSQYTDVEKQVWGILGGTYESLECP